MPFHENLSDILQTVFFIPKWPPVESIWQAVRIRSFSFLVLMYLNFTTWGESACPCFMAGSHTGGWGGGKGQTQIMWPEATLQWTCAA